MKFLPFLASAAFSATILEIVSQSPDHTTLASLTDGFTDLQNLLDAPGNLTLFAPTNNAFEKLDKAITEALTNNQDLLYNVLTYHVLPSTVFDPATAPKKSFPVTALGKPVGITVNGDVQVSFGLRSAKVTASNKADNGVVHIVDGVLLQPPSASSTAKAAGLNELVKALSTANLVAAVDGAKAATIFAPTDAAFKALYAFADKAKLNITNDLLTEILKFHVVPKVVYSTDIIAAKGPIAADTLSGTKVNVTVVGGAVKVNGPGNTAAATVSTADVLYNNGVVHVIDAVLLPKSLGGVTPSSAASVAYSLAFMMTIAVAYF